MAAVDVDSLWYLYYGVCTNKTVQSKGKIQLSSKEIAISLEGSIFLFGVGFSLIRGG